MKRLSLVIIFAISVFFPMTSFAHPGRTDSSGCHTCRTNCTKWGLSTGEYHCHRAKTLPQPKEPIKSHFSETGGYTTPAPEYKQPAIPTSKVTTEVKPKVEKVETVPLVNNVKSQTPIEAKSGDGWIIKLLKFLFK
ncbi:MAG: YHYH domain-containing protein [Candidatus Magasanikiibacteriota bacterium]